MQADVNPSSICIQPDQGCHVLSILKARVFQVISELLVCWLNADSGKRRESLSSSVLGLGTAAG